jgi:hypothetical protein
MSVVQTHIRYVDLSFEELCRRVMGRDESWKRPQLRVVRVEERWNEHDGPVYLSALEVKCSDLAMV